MPEPLPEPVAVADLVAALREWACRVEFEHEEGLCIAAATALEDTAAERDRAQGVLELLENARYVETRWVVKDFEPSCIVQVRAWGDLRIGQGPTLLEALRDALGENP